MQDLGPIFSVSIGLVHEISYPHPVDKYLKLAIDNDFYIYILGGIKVVCMMKKTTSTYRICEAKSTPIGWSSGIWFGGQFVNPPKKSTPKVYSTSSLSKIENFEIYDNNYKIQCKKLWTKLVIEIGQGRSVKTLNEWEKMLLKQFGKLKYKA